MNQTSNFFQETCVSEKFVIIQVTVRCCFKLKNENALLSERESHYINKYVPTPCISSECIKKRAFGVCRIISNFFRHPV